VRLGRGLLAHAARRGEREGRGEGARPGGRKERAGPVGR